MKPYFSKKSCGTQSKIILQDNDKIVTKNVDEVFNKFFVNVAQDIGKDYTFNKNDHPSLQKIEDKIFVKNSFEFKSINETFVSKVIDKFNVNKGNAKRAVSPRLKIRPCDLDL
jgi:alpha-N-acetylglucosamine transferase